LSAAFQNQDLPLPVGRRLKAIAIAGHHIAENAAIFERSFELLPNLSGYQLRL